MEGIHLAPANEGCASGPRGVSSVDLRRLCPLLVFALLIWLVLAAASNAAAAQASPFRGNAACNLLDYASTVAPEVLNGQPGSLLQGPGYCQIGRCWAQVTDPNDPEQTICHYARGALLDVKIHATAGQARKAVRRDIARGYKREKLAGSDLAGFIVSSEGAAVVMAVDNTAVLFSFGASSDDDPNPTWTGASQLIHAAARDIAKGLGRSGCPEVPRRCPGSVTSP